MMSGFEITSVIRSSCQTDSVRLRGGGGGRGRCPPHTHNVHLHGPGEAHLTLGGGDI